MVYHDRKPGAATILKRTVSCQVQRLNRMLERTAPHAAETCMTMAYPDRRTECFDLGAVQQHDEQL